MSKEKINYERPTTCIVNQYFLEVEYASWFHTISVGCWLQIAQASSSLSRKDKAARSERILFKASLYQ